MRRASPRQLPLGRGRIDTDCAKHGRRDSPTTWYVVFLFVAAALSPACSRSELAEHQEVERSAVEFFNTARDGDWQKARELLTPAVREGCGEEFLMLAQGFAASNEVLYRRTLFDVHFLEDDAALVRPNSGGSSILLEEIDGEWRVSSFNVSERRPYC